MSEDDTLIPVTPKIPTPEDVVKWLQEADSFIKVWKMQSPNSYAVPLSERIVALGTIVWDIDTLIARRPALDEKTRFDNVAKAIRVASERDELARQLDLLKGNYDRKVDECREEYRRAEDWHRVADERSAEIVRLQKQWVPFKQPQTEAERYDESQREAHKELDKVSDAARESAIVCCFHGQFTILNPCPQCNPLQR